MDTASHATILETCQTGDCTVWKAIIVLQLELGHPAKTLYRTQTGISGEPCGGQERSTCTCSILLPHLLPLSKPRLPRHSRPNAGPFPLDLQLICDFLHLPSSLSLSFLSLFLATLKLCVILVAPAALYRFDPQPLDFHHRQHLLHFTSSISHTTRPSWPPSRPSSPMEPSSRTRARSTSQSTPWRSASRRCSRQTDISIAGNVNGQCQ